MNKFPHTWDGKPITGNVTGWSEYTTLDQATTTSPPPNITVGDILAQIRQVRQTLSQPKVDKALKDLYEHIANTKNPHKTNLSQFTEEVIDILYDEYVDNGGTGNKDFYIQSLFYTLRVASLEEMESANDENLLVSVKGAHRVISAHENDVHAHEALFAKWFPGEPVTADPVIAINASFGVLPEYLYVRRRDNSGLDESVNVAGTINEEQTYTIIDVTGKLVELPLNRGITPDWGLSQPLLPCFGDYTNLFRNSSVLNDQLLYRQNLGYRDAPDVVGPNGKKGEVVDVYATDDYISVEHNLVRLNFELPIGETKTVSIFVKPDKCRYFAIRFTDMVATGMEAQAIYNLDECTVTMINQLGRYTAEIHRLSNGWRRCCFTMNHNIGQKADLLFTFFNLDTLDVLNSYAYKAVAGTVGYVWGIQLEDKLSASPYIDTGDTAVTKAGHYHIFDIENKFDVNDMTISIQFRNPKYWGRKELKRPILEIVDSEWQPIWSINMLNTGAINIERFVYQQITDDVSVPTVEFYDSIAPSDEDWGQFALSIDRRAICSNYNGVPGLGLESPKKSRAGYRLLLGCNVDGVSFDGYIREFTIFDRAVSAPELEFVTGEIIHD